MERKFKRNPNGERNRQKNNWREGANSVEQALEQFEPMVHRFANYYSKGLLSKNNSLLDAEDLCQVGRMAIVVAYQMFDPKYEAQLSTWTYHKIKCAMLDYIKENYSCISGGSYVISHIFALKKNGEEISVENLRKRGVSRKTAIAALEDLPKACRPDCYGVGHQTSFYDIESGTVEGFETDERISTDDIDRIEGFRLENFKPYLSDGEYFIIKNHFGFDCDRITMEEIGSVIGKSRKAVSYALNRALVKMRHIPGIDAYAELAQ